MGGISVTAGDHQAENSLLRSCAPVGLKGNARTMTDDAGTAKAGVNSVNREVVEKISASAAREVPGVVELGGDVARFFNKVLDAVGLDEVGDATRGVQAHVKGASVEIDVVVVMATGSIVADVARAVQAKVTEAVVAYGLTVTGVNVKVDDIEMPQEATPSL
jgi:uncharacterized alkaline shock family protein YloU